MIALLGNETPIVGGQRPSKAVHRKNLLEPLWLGNAKIATDLPRKMVVDFGMPWD
jgi:hypothetical protein